MHHFEWVSTFCPRTAAVWSRTTSCCSSWCLKSTGWKSKAVSWFSVHSWMGEISLEESENQRCSPTKNIHEVETSLFIWALFDHPWSLSIVGCYHHQPMLPPLDQSVRISFQKARCYVHNFWDDLKAPGCHCTCGPKIKSKQQKTCMSRCGIKRKCHVITVEFNLKYIYKDVFF